jgi:hypothetical protein
MMEMLDEYYLMKRVKEWLDRGFIGWVIK